MLAKDLIESLQILSKYKIDVEIWADVVSLVADPVAFPGTIEGHRDYVRMKELGWSDPEDAFGNWNWCVDAE